MKKFLFLAGSAALALASATSASATTITFTVNGFGTAFTGNGVVEGAYVITGVGDTDTYFNPPQAPTANVIALDSFSISFGNTTYTSLLPVAFFTNPSVNVGGFNTFNPMNNQILTFLVFQFAQPNSYNALTSFGPVGIQNGGSQYVAGPGPNFGHFLPTDGGPFQWLAPRVNSFSAELSSLQPVPEPASWAMMIAGFGIAGAAMRRKAKVSTKVSYS